MYEVVAPLGAGGMGEVYRARDTRLNRDVAVTLLPAMFTTGVPSKRQYDIPPDGRFVSIIAAGQTDAAGAAPQIRVVVNWFTELQRPAK